MALFFSTTAIVYADVIPQTWEQLPNGNWVPSNYDGGFLYKPLENSQFSADPVSYWITYQILSQGNSIINASSDSYTPAFINDISGVAPIYTYVKINPVETSLGHKLVKVKDIESLDLSVYDLNNVINKTFLSPDSVVPNPFDDLNASEQDYLRGIYNIFDYPGINYGTNDNVLSSLIYDLYPDHCVATYASTNNNTYKYLISDPDFKIFIDSDNWYIYLYKNDIDVSNQIFPASYYYYDNGSIWPYRTLFINNSNGNLDLFGTSSIQSINNLRFSNINQDQTSLLDALKKLKGNKNTPIYIGSDYETAILYTPNTPISDAIIKRGSITDSQGNKLIRSFTDNDYIDFTELANLIDSSISDASVLSIDSLNNVIVDSSGNATEPVYVPYNQVNASEDEYSDLIKPYQFSAPDPLASEEIQAVASNIGTGTTIIDQASNVIPPGAKLFLIGMGFIILCALFIRRLLE